MFDEYVSKLLDRLKFTENELKEIDVLAHKEINIISERRKSESTEVRRKLDKAILDLEYLNREKLTLLRLGSTPEDIKKDQDRLNLEIENSKKVLNGKTESAKDLIDFVASFSELIKNTGIYWKYALDTEKNEIMRIIFSELSISSENRNFLGNKGFNLLLRRSPYHLRTLCAVNGIFPQLSKICVCLLRERLHNFFRSRPRLKNRLFKACFFRLSNPTYHHYK